VNFSVYSRSASGIELVFFDREEDALPARVLPLDPAAFVLDFLPFEERIIRREGVRLFNVTYFDGALAPLLDGLGEADTIGLDLHKLGWQPIAAGVLLVREAAMFGPLEQRAAYLNPEDDEEAGYTSLLGRSLRTTRRADAFKIAVTLRNLGRAGLGALVDRCHDLAGYAAERIAAEPRLELTAEPVLTTVLFRYLPLRGAAGPEEADRVNAALRRLLLEQGNAVVGRTELGSGPGSVRLKLTLLNPHTTTADLDRLIALVLTAGAEADEQSAEQRDSEQQHAEQQHAEQRETNS